MIPIIAGAAGVGGALIAGALFWYHKKRKSARLLATGSSSARSRGVVSRKWPHPAGSTASSEWSYDSKSPATLGVTPNSSRQVQLQSTVTQLPPPPGLTPNSSSRVQLQQPQHFDAAQFNPFNAFHSMQLVHMPPSGPGQPAVVHVPVPVPASSAGGYLNPAAPAGSRMTGRLDPAALPPGRVVQVLRTYEPSANDEVDVLEGDLVMVFEVLGGWAVCKNTSNRIGAVPVSCLQL